MSGKYLTAREAFGDGQLSWVRDEIKAQLVSFKYEFDEAHETIDEVGGLVGEAVEVPARGMAAGWASAGALHFEQVSGPEVAALVFYRASDGKLVEYHNAIERFPLQPNGGDLEIEVRAPGIFRL